MALLIFLMPPLRWFLSLVGRGFGVDTSFRDKHFAVSYSLHAGQLWTSVLTTIYYKKKLLCWGLRDTMIYG